LNEENLGEINKRSFSFGSQRQSLWDPENNGFHGKKKSSIKEGF